MNITFECISGSTSNEAEVFLGYQNSVVNPLSQNFIGQNFTIPTITTYHTKMAFGTENNLEQYFVSNFISKKESKMVEFM